MLLRGTCCSRSKVTSGYNELYGAYRILAIHSAALPSTDTASIRLHLATDMDQCKRITSVSLGGVGAVLTVRRTSAEPDDQLICLSVTLSDRL